MKSLVLTQFLLVSYCAIGRSLVKEALVCAHQKLLERIW